MSTISRTSPSASAYGLPISAVTIRASASALSSTKRPIWAIARPRTGAGTDAQPSWAFFAASAALTKVDASPNATSPTTSSSRAGLVLAAIRPPGTDDPSMTELTVFIPPPP